MKIDGQEEREFPDEEEIERMVEEERQRIEKEEKRRNEEEERKRLEEEKKRAEEEKRRIEEEKKREEEESKRNEKIKERLKEEYEEIIEISISEYIDFFSEIEIDQPYENTMTNYDQTHQIQLKEKYTLIKIEYDGIIEIEIPKETEIRMAVKIHSFHDYMSFTNHVFPRNADLKKEYISSTNKNDPITINIKRLTYDKTTRSIETFDMRIKSDKNVKMTYCEVTDLDCIVFSDELDERNEKCAFCHNLFNSKEEVMKIDYENLKPINCHRSCYQCIRCCRCQCKHKDSDGGKDYVLNPTKYIRSLKRFVCFDCLHYFAGDNMEKMFSFK